MNNPKPVAMPSTQSNPARGFPFVLVPARGRKQPLQAPQPG